jgi:hypothetical protein
VESAAQARRGRGRELYIIDREGHRIEVFDKNLNYLREIRNDWNPWDVNISRKGTDGIGWIADHKDERVQKFSLKDGKILAVWGKQGWGPGEFDWVHGIVVDSKGRCTRPTPTGSGYRNLRRQDGIHGGTEVIAARIAPSREATKDLHGFFVSSCFRGYPDCGRQQQKCRGDRPAAVPLTRVP